MPWMPPAPLMCPPMRLARWKSGRRVMPRPACPDWPRACGRRTGGGACVRGPRMCSRRSRLPGPVSWSSGRVGKCLKSRSANFVAVIPISPGSICRAESFPRLVHGSRTRTWRGPWKRSRAKGGKGFTGVRWRSRSPRPRDRAGDGSRGTISRPTKRGSPSRCAWVFATSRWWPPRPRPAARPCTCRS